MAVDKKSLNEALAKHRRADPGTDKDLKTTYANRPIIGRPHGFRSGHVARNGQRFGVTTDFDSNPVQTNVHLKK